MDRKLSSLIIIFILYSLNIKSATTKRGNVSGNNPTTNIQFPLMAVAMAVLKIQQRQIH